MAGLVERAGNDLASVSLRRGHRRMLHTPLSAGMHAPADPPWQRS
jgi:hypothetical protein